MAVCKTKSTTAVSSQEGSLDSKEGSDWKPKEARAQKEEAPRPSPKKQLWTQERLQKIFVAPPSPTADQTPAVLPCQPGDSLDSREGSGFEGLEGKGTPEGESPKNGGPPNSPQGFQGRTKGSLGGGALDFSALQELWSQECLVKTSDGEDLGVTETAEAPASRRIPNPHGLKNQRGKGRGDLKSRGWGGRGLGDGEVQVRSVAQNGEEASGGDASPSSTSAAPHKLRAEQWPKELMINRGGQTSRPANLLENLHHGEHFEHTVPCVIGNILLLAFSTCTSTGKACWSYNKT